MQTVDCGNIFKYSEFRHPSIIFPYAKQVNFDVLLRDCSDVAITGGRDLYVLYMYRVPLPSSCSRESADHSTHSKIIVCIQTVFKLRKITRRQ